MTLIDLFLSRPFKVLSKKKSSEAKAWLEGSGLYEGLGNSDAIFHWTVSSITVRNFIFSLRLVLPPFFSVVLPH